MKKIGLREVQEIELNILKEFADFCDRNDLAYYLDAGTLLGAMRHQGFIPWDDDVDVCMLRPDYDRFVRLLKENNKMLTDHIRLETEEDSLYPYLKLVDDRTVLVEYPDENPLYTGIYIDIFAKEGIQGKCKEEKKRSEKVLRLIRLSWYLTYSVTKWQKSENLFKRIVGNVLHAVVRKPEKYKMRAIQLAQKYDISQCSHVLTLTSENFYSCMEKSVFQNRINVTFEGYTFTAPAGYDRYLRKLYKGDYMIPPPEEKRIRHTVEVYWKE